MRQQKHDGPGDFRGSSPRRKLLTYIAALAAASTLTGWAADSQAPISRAEYDALMQQVSALQKEVSDLRKEQAAQTSAPAQPAATGPAQTASAGGSSWQKSFRSLQGEIDDVKSNTDFIAPGDTRFVIAGSASASFSTFSNTPSNFGATFAPIFLWQLNDKLLVESEVELELNGTSTQLNLEYVDISYELNDYMVVDAGKFLNPMNIFVERYEPNWINKLPDTPLAVYDGILPETNVGAQLRGAVPLGPTRLKYAAYISNAPLLTTSDPGAAGQLQFDNFSSVSYSKAYGGRLGFEAFPGVEAGYGMQYSNVSPDSGSGSTTAFLQSADLEIKRDSPTLKGSFTLLGQYGWSQVGNFNYASAGDGPLSFNNFRDGGYLQLSYRPRRLSDFLNRFEVIARGDMINAPAGAPGAYDERRLTFGLDYWLTSFTVLKAAYEIDNRTNGVPNQNGFLLQLATGL